MKHEKKEESTVRIIRATKDGITKHWPGQLFPQPVYVEIDPKANTIRAAYDPEVNGLPIDVYNRLRIRLYLGNNDYRTARNINKLMREINPLAARIIKGYRLDTDGMNMIGELSSDAEEAYNELILLVVNQDELMLMTQAEREELNWESRL